MGGKSNLTHSESFRESNKKENIGASLNISLFTRCSNIFFFITLSKTFTMCEVRLTGLFCSGFCLLPPLCMGVTYAILNISGIFPLCVFLWFLWWIHCLKG